VSTSKVHGLGRDGDLFASFHTPLEPEDLVDVVPDRQLITEKRGAVESAPTVVATVFGQTSRSFDNWQAANAPVFATAAFAQRIGRPGMLRYTLTLFGFTDEEITGITMAWVRARSTKSNTVIPPPQN
jgi:hypothetical protein